MEHRYCNLCGNLLGERDVYCSICGTKVEAPGSIREVVELEDVTNDSFDSVNNRQNESAIHYYSSESVQLPDPEKRFDDHQDVFIRNRARYQERMKNQQSVGNYSGVLERQAGGDPKYIPQIGSKNTANPSSTKEEKGFVVVYKRDLILLGILAVVALGILIFWFYEKHKMQEAINEVSALYNQQEYDKAKDRLDRAGYEISGIVDKSELKEYKTLLDARDAYEEEKYQYVYDHLMGVKTEDAEQLYRDAKFVLNMEEAIDQFQYSKAQSLISSSEGNVSQEYIDYYSLVVYEDTFAISEIYRAFNNYEPKVVNITELSWNKTENGDVEITCELTVPQVLTNGNYASIFDEYSLKYTHGKWEYYNKGKQDYARSGMEAALSLYDIQNDQISIEHGQKTWKDINNIDRYSQKVANGQLEPITCIIGYESKENTTNTPLLSFDDT